MNIALGVVILCLGKVANEIRTIVKWIRSHVMEANAIWAGMDRR